MGRTAWQGDAALAQPDDPESGGGIVNGIFVHEGDIAEPRQRLAMLDRARFSSMPGEAEAKARAELDQVKQVVGGRRDQLDRTELRSPVRGIVKNLEVTTIGGVIQPGGSLMEIVPLEKQLLIEARMSPRDIAFIRPGLPATVKITAYDPSIYGTLAGTVDRISPDTLQDEVHRDQVYYRVYVRTGQSSLRTKDGRTHAIMPGMVATVEIRTGRKTVLQYLMKPINKAQEALRER